MNWIEGLLERFEDWFLMLTDEHWGALEGGDYRGGSPLKVL